MHRGDENGARLRWEEKRGGKSSRVNAGAERVKIKDTKETKRRSAKRKEGEKKKEKEEPGTR